MKTKYYRRSNSSTGVNDVPWLMFALDREAIASYGEYEFWADDENATDSADLEEEIASMLEEHTNILDEYGSSAEELASDASPDDIVNSAGIWDNADLTQLIFDEILAPKNITKVKTPDGMMVFDTTFVFSVKKGGKI